MDKEVIKSFVDSWGMMGSVWGVNTSVARVHALLIASDAPMSLDDIALRLKMSRGNANTCLRELRNWCVIRLVKVPGDRHDYYETESDIWKMTFAIARERKKREFNPALRVVRETLSKLRKGSSVTIEHRLKEMEGLLSTIDTLAERFLANESLSRKAVALLSALSKGR